MMQGTKAGALWQPGGMEQGRRWERGSRGKGHTYAYGQFMLVHGRGHHNTVIILQVKQINNFS